MSNFKSEHTGVLQAILSALQVAVAGEEMICRYITVTTDSGTLPWLPDCVLLVCLVKLRLGFVKKDLGIHIG